MGPATRYFLRGMVHKTKHKSPLNFGVDEWQGVERLYCSAVEYWARLALDTGEFKRFYYAFFLKGLGSHSYRGWPVAVI